jgi:hypothetical protein
MPKGSAWRSFLSKSSNKQRLQNFLAKEWEKYDHNVDWFFTMNLHCYDLASGECDLVFEAPTACEADTRAFYHAAKLGDSSTIVLDFEDTSVWMISSYVSHLLHKICI